MKPLNYFTILCLFLFSANAYAYIGPGVGLSVIGTAIALIGAVLLLVIGFFWYPIKRLLGRSKDSDGESK
jgi:hypothetical protein